MASITGKYTVRYVDGRTQDVTVTLGDRIEGETAARRNKWGDLQKAPQRQLSYAVWSALRRAGTEPGEYKEWLYSVADFEAETIDDEEEDGDESGE